MDHTERLRQVIEERIGISLDNDKTYLLDSRLGEMMEQNNLQSYSALADKMEKDPQCLEEITNRITTNETRFFRDERVYEAFFQYVVPELVVNEGEIHIWSMGCSTGQEPYSIAMKFQTTHPDICHWLKIHASDISKRVIEKARTGIYSQLEASRGLSDYYRSKFFIRHGKHFKINDQISDMVTFDVQNFTKLSFQVPYNVVFFRNVSIYFEQKIRMAVFERLYNLLPPNGIILLGSSEIGFHYLPNAELMKAGNARFYRKKS